MDETTTHLYLGDLGDEVEALVEFEIDDLDINIGYVTARFPGRDIEVSDLLTDEAKAELVKDIEHELTQRQIDYYDGLGDYLYQSRKENAA